ncbi:hypothetical protein BDW74DRAFT_102672 [Aspergillus multicolor]|uniref:uncharacterized protein n=1 Tax=Aspergillus multicolor TaxID=41759 RepID=UPI003CCDF534
MDMANDDKEYKCRFCRKEWDTAGSRDLHERQMCDMNPNKKRTRWMNASTRGHTKPNVDGQPAFKCRYCHQTCLMGDFLEVHERQMCQKKTPDNTDSCQFCGETCGTKTARQIHENECKKNPAKSAKPAGRSITARPPTARPPTGRPRGRPRTWPKPAKGPEPAVADPLKPYQCRHCHKGYTRDGDRRNHESKCKWKPAVIPEGQRTEEAGLDNAPPAGPCLVVEPVNGP